MLANAQFATSDELTEVQLRDVAGVVAIGRVSSIRNLPRAEEDPEDWEEAYQEYLELHEELYGSSVEPLSSEELNSIAGGWTTILLKNGFFIDQIGFVLIPPDEIDEIAYASTFSVFMIGNRQDLISARRDFRSPFLVFDKVLCREDDESFDECRDEYHHGLYDGLNGHEVDIKFRYVEGGNQIDPATYKLRN